VAVLNVTATMAEAPLLDFVVPDDLLQATVRQRHAEDAVADLQLMPGVGHGKPPPMRRIFRSYGLAPVTTLFFAPLVVGTIDSGLGVVAPDIQYVSDYYPPEARARVVAYKRGSGPVARTFGIAAVGGVAAATGNWRSARTGIRGRTSSGPYASTRTTTPTTSARPSPMAASTARAGSSSTTSNRWRG
jgi:hypothetical protein